jgi:tight adherence protein B
MTLFAAQNLAPIALAGLVAAAIGLLAVILGNLYAQNRAGTRLDSVLARYARNIGAGERAALGGGRLGDSRLGDSKLGSAGRPGWLTKSPALARFIKATDEKLAAAGILVTAQNWVLGAAAASTIAAVLTGVFLGSAAVGFLTWIAVLWYLLRAFLNSRIAARRTRFAQELPQVLAVAANGLRVGLTLHDSIRAAAASADSADQATSVVAGQFSRAIAEVQFGSTLEEALGRVATRMENPDLRWLVLALEIHREVGGSLTGILDSVVETIRARVEVRREIQVISAEGRLSGYVLVALPILSFVGLEVLRPDYVKFFWTQPIGWLLSAVYVVLVVLGWFWMKRVVRVDV